MRSKVQPFCLKEGELTVNNLNYSDAGQYTCAARNILGSSEATCNLSVRGKRKTETIIRKFNTQLLNSNDL